MLVHSGARADPRFKELMREAGLSSHSAALGMAYEASLPSAFPMISTGSCTSPYFRKPSTKWASMLILYLDINAAKHSG